MSTNIETNKVAKDLVVSMDYELTVEGEVVDSSYEDDPIEFIQGHQNILPALEKAVEGLKVGESKNVSLKAADAYGEYDPERVIEVPKAEFPEEIPLEIGMEISVTDDDGEEDIAFIEEVNVDSITLNLNHPLAGKDLDFKIKIVDIREATPEELEHGHVHGDECECGDDCDCGEDCDCGKDDLHFSNN